jgi:hypothetical protein
MQPLKNPPYILVDTFAGSSFSASAHKSLAALEAACGTNAVSSPMIGMGRGTALNDPLPAPAPAARLVAF